MLSLAGGALLRCAGLTNSCAGEIKTVSDCHTAAAYRKFKVKFLLKLNSVGVAKTPFCHNTIATVR
jgi:hypothetical protein